MASLFSKSAVVCLALNLLPACGVEDPNPANEGSGGAQAGSPAVGGAAAGSGGSPGAVGGSGGAAGASAGSSSGGGGAGGQVAGGSGGGGGSGFAGAGGLNLGGGSAVPFVLTSPMLAHVEACAEENHEPCSVFPKANEMMSMNGDNLSPELAWGPGPAGTQSYVITLHDFSNGFTHWAIWNIPAATLKLPAGLARDSKPALPTGAQQKSFDQDNAGFGYMGPGADDHVYEFRLYALNVATFTPKSPGEQGKIYEELEANAGNFVLGTSMLRGRSKKY